MKATLMGKHFSKGFPLTFPGNNKRGQKVGRLPVAKSGVKALVGRNSPQHSADMT